MVSVSTAAVAPLARLSAWRARQCVRGTSAGRVRPSYLVAGAGPQPAARLEHAAPAEARRRGCRARAARRARLPYRHGEARRGASLRRRSMTSIRTGGDGVKEGAGGITAPSPERAPLPVFKLDERRIAARRDQRRIMEFVAAHDAHRRSGFRKARAARYPRWSSVAQSSWRGRAVPPSRAERHPHLRGPARVYAPALRARDASRRSARNCVAAAEPSA